MSKESEQKRNVFLISIGITSLVVMLWALSFDIPKIDESDVAENERTQQTDTQQKNNSFFGTVRVGFTEVKDGLTALVGIDSK